MIDLGLRIQRRASALASVRRNIDAVAEANPSPPILEISTVQKNGFGGNV